MLSHAGLMEWEQATPSNICNLASYEHLNIWILHQIYYSIFLRCCRFLNSILTRQCEANKTNGSMCFLFCFSYCTITGRMEKYRIERIPRIWKLFVQVRFSSGLYAIIGNCFVIGIVVHRSSEMRIAIETCILESWRRKRRKDERSSQNLVYHCYSDENSRKPSAFVSIKMTL